MGKFTEEDIEILKQNPYTLRVSESMLSLTPEFKTEFINRYKLGHGPKRIFIELGYDPKILGDKRI